MGKFRRAFRDRYREQGYDRRDPDRPRIAGVCVAIAQQFGLRTKLVRVALILSAVFFFFPTVVIYTMLSFVLRPREKMEFASPEQAKFWDGLAKDPPRTIHTLRDTLRRAEQRVVRIEALVTSDEFDLRRRFRDIGG